MSGSSPLAEAVTRSTGTGPVACGSAARSAATRPATASRRALLVGPRLDPLDAEALYENGLVAESRPQKYYGSSNGCPISVEPIACPSRLINLPCAWRGRAPGLAPSSLGGRRAPSTP